MFFKSNADGEFHQAELRKGDRLVWNPKNGNLRIVREGGVMIWNREIGENAQHPFLQNHMGFRHMAQILVCFLLNPPTPKAPEYSGQEWFIQFE